MLTVHPVSGPLTWHFKPLARCRRLRRRRGPAGASPAPRASVIRWLAASAGGDDIGVALVAHPDTAMISFTGSVAAGRSIARSAGDSLKRMVLELGGNDAAIVLPDVDVKAIAPKILVPFGRRVGVNVLGRCGSASGWR